MSMNAKQLRELIVAPTLKDMGMWSPSAENLIMGTAAQESHLGHYLKQVGKGPALGVYQCEPFTHADIVNYIDRGVKVKFGRIIPGDLMPKGVDNYRLVYDLRYATMIARIHYYRKSEPLPAADDVEGLARYWKIWYNSVKGKGTVAEFVKNYELTR
jgi:hypothetical protein